MTKKERRKMKQMGQFTQKTRTLNTGNKCIWWLTLSNKQIEVTGIHQDRVQFFKKFGYDNHWAEHMACMSEITDNLVTAR